MTEEFLKGQNPAAVRFRAGQTHGSAHTHRESNECINEKIYTTTFVLFALLESPISEDKVRLLEVGPEEAGPSCSS